MDVDLTGIGSVADLAKGLVDRFFPPSMTDAERAQATLGLQEQIEKRESAVLDTQKSVIVAEMNQSDNYTKRARPTIVYFGLVAIGIVHVLLPVIAWIILMVKGIDIKTNMPDITLPGHFWAAWGGVCSIWVIGRSAEKKGVTNKLIGMITGSK